MAHSRAARAHTIGTDDPDRLRLSDAQIAAEATRRLAWDAAIPAGTVTVEVKAGRVTLRGRLECVAQRLAALEDVARLFGVTSVCDRLSVGEA